MDFAKLGEDARSAAVGASADCVEAIHRAKKAAEGGEPCPPSRATRSDFLYDLIQLNADYWTQLARLGSSYSVFAYRLVEVCYSTYARPERTPKKSETPKTGCLTFRGPPGTSASLPITLANATKGDQKPQLHEVLLKSALTTIPVQTHLVLEDGYIPPGGSARAIVSIELPNGVVGSTWSGVLKVALGESIMEFPVEAVVL